MPYLGMEPSQTIEQPAIQTEHATFGKKPVKTMDEKATKSVNDALPDEQTLNGEAAPGEASELVSQLPSPPESVTTTPPKVTIAPLPSRLMNFIPPPNYGMVERNTVYRSGFPHDKNLNFMNSLHIRSILKLVDTECSESLKKFLTTYHVKQAHISIAANKDGHIKMTTESIAKAILFVSDPANYPVYIHCNQGKHRTGCVIACLRKCQQVPIDEVLEEYKTYAYPKERPGDIAFIKAFDPQCLEEFADREELNRRFPGAYRVDSKTDMLEFAGDGASQAPPSLPTAGSSSSSEGTQFSSGESDVSAEDLTLVLMTRPFPHEQPLAGAAPFWAGEEGGPLIRDFANQRSGGEHGYKVEEKEVGDEEENEEEEDIGEQTLSLRPCDAHALETETLTAPSRLEGENLESGATTSLS